MELSNTEQLHEAKSRLSSSMRKLEQAVNARIGKVKEKAANQVQQFSQDQGAESQKLVENLKEELASLAEQNKVLQGHIVEREAAYDRLKIMSEQSVDVLDVAIAKLEACNSGE